MKLILVDTKFNGSCDENERTPTLINTEQIVTATDYGDDETRVTLTNDEILTVTMPWEQFKKLLNEC